MKYEYSYNGKIISYEKIIKNVKNINIRVKPNGLIVVSCDNKVKHNIIELEIFKRTNRLLSTIEEYKYNMIKFQELNPRLVDGEAFLLFGKILRIKNLSSNKFNVTFDNNYLYIHRKDKKGIKQKFEIWYASYVNSVFNELVERCLIKFKKNDIEKPTIIIKMMKTRWGTCNPIKNIITLNIQLAKVDPYLSEYIIYHELIHFKYRYHTKDFYRFLTVFVPDWRQREQILNKNFINELGGNL